MRVSLKGVLVASYNQSNIVLNNIVLRLDNPNFDYVSFKLATFISIKGHSSILYFIFMGFYGI